MQEALKDLGKSVKITILAQGEVFTLARASVFLTKLPGEKKHTMNSIPPDDKFKEFCMELFGEGIARKSHLDAQDANLGQQIAIGRAIKSLSRKLQSHGKVVIRHRYMG